MQVTIEIEPRTFSLIEKAKADGVSLDGVLLEALDRYDDEKSLPQHLSANQRIERLKNWAYMPRNLPPLSDEMFRRDTIYVDRT